METAKGRSLSGVATMLCPVTVNCGTSQAEPWASRVRCAKRALLARSWSAVVTLATMRVRSESRRRCEADLVTDRQPPDDIEIVFGKRAPDLVAESAAAIRNRDSTRCAVTISKAILQSPSVTRSRSA